MKRLILFLVFGIGATVGILAWYFDVQVEISHASDAQTIPEITKNPVETLSSSDSPAITSVIQSSDLVASAEDDPTEIIEGHRVRVNRDCDIKVHYFENEDGTSDSAIECVKGNPSVPDPYTTYSDEVLTNLAYGDPKAAEILGRRWIQRAQGENAGELKALGVVYHLRAAALSGDVTHITRAAGRAYSHISSSSTGAKVDNIINHFVLDEVAARLGKQSQSNMWRPAIEALDLSTDQLNDIEQSVLGTMRGIAEIQTNVTGGTDFAEVLTDA